MAVNGSTEQDWPEVLKLARRHKCVLPSFGLHPRYIAERSTGWQKSLIAHLDAVPSAVGEIGLDRWIENFNSPDQEAVFTAQLRIAAERNLPVTIHCLRAWGRLHELLTKHSSPLRGFLLHSYGGSREMVPRFAELGAYFSISGQFATDWKARQRETFLHVPIDRLLIETDAPFMLPPESRITHPLRDPGTGQPVNHPANLGSIYEFSAALLGLSLGDLAPIVEKNFLRFFAGL